MSHDPFYRITIKANAKKLSRLLFSHVTPQLTGASFSIVCMS